MPTHGPDPLDILFVSQSRAAAIGLLNSLEPTVCKPSGRDAACLTPDLGGRAPSTHTALPRGPQGRRCFFAWSRKGTTVTYTDHATRFLVFSLSLSCSLLSSLARSLTRSHRGYLALPGAPPHGHDTESAYLAAQDRVFSLDERGLAWACANIPRRNACSVSLLLRLSPCGRFHRIRLVRRWRCVLRPRSVIG